MKAVPARVAMLLPSLGRENDHEVVATARAIERALKSVGADWHDLADALRPAPFAAPVLGKRTVDFAGVARACRALDRGRLSDRERTFINDVSRRGVTWRPSTRQAAWLAAIHDRLRSEAA